MARCSRCGKFGLFLKLKNGICQDCIESDRISELQRQEEERQRKRAQRCDKCRRNGLETEIELGSVCNACRDKYPRIRDCLTEAKPTYQKWFLCNLDYIRNCRRKFIAFDLETTGLSSWSDKIVEISAVVFENLAPVAEFSTLVNPEMRISASASAVNGISNEDVKDAPYIHEAIENFCDFIGPDALSGDIPMVAHNADFDIKFLLTAFKSCGVNANIFLQDTLYMSRWMNTELYRHKLCDVARYFGIPQHQAHRAADDAQVCGEIFAAMLRRREQRLIEKKNQLLPIELHVCEWLKSECEADGLNTQLLTVKSAKTFCALKCVSEVLRIKARGKSPYILLPIDCPVPDGLSASVATKSEGEGNKRVHFSEASDLYPLRDYLVERYRRALESSLDEINSSIERFQFASEAAAHEISL